jgi:hypothetical protein
MIITVAAHINIRAYQKSHPHCYRFLSLPSALKTVPRTIIRRRKSVGSIAS